MTENLEKIVAAVDHTLLTRTAVWDEIRQLCDDAVFYHTASVCIAPSYVRQAGQYLAGRVPVCTVIGFPNGYSTAKSKTYEAFDALENGADEIDMVINLTAVKDNRYEDILSEIRAVKAVCGEKILKVIVETCFLTEEEKIKMCAVVSESGADFIKTSTGFGSAGATREDISLFASHVANHVRIKAAGGIQTLQDAADFLKLGASRLGTSSVIKLIKNQNAGDY